MPLSSNSLFHFTSKGSAILKKILETGFKPSYVLEPNIALMLVDSTYKIPQHITRTNEGKYFDFRLYIPLVCFCDIPLGAVNSHALKYSGHEKRVYGIGLSKSWGLTNEIHPISYVIPSGKIVKALRTSIIAAQVPVSPPPQGYDYIPPDIYCEPVEMGNGHMVRDNKGFQYPIQMLYTKPIGEIFNHSEENYQDEKEWRYIPSNAMLISLKAQMSHSTNYQYYQIERANAEKALEQAREKNSYSNLIFTPNDITHIIIHEESEVNDFLDFLYELYKTDYTDSEIRVLMSKVTSYERIQKDYSYT